LASIGGPSKNLTKFDSLSLLNFPSHDYVQLLAVAQSAFHVRHPQQIFIASLNKPLQPPCAALSGPLVFNILEDLPSTDINAEHMDTSTEPISIVVAMVDGGDPLFLMDS
jgi:hypothetical protein